MNDIFGGTIVVFVVASFVVCMFIGVSFLGDSRVVSKFRGEMVSRGLATIRYDNGCFVVEWNDKIKGDERIDGSELHSLQQQAVDRGYGKFVSDQRNGSFSFVWHEKPTNKE